MITKVKLNVPMYGFAADTIIDIDCYIGGTPKDFFWRQRFQDSLYDNCLVIIANDENLKHNKLKIEKLRKTDTYSNKE